MQGGCSPRRNRSTYGEQDCKLNRNDWSVPEAGWILPEVMFRKTSRETFWGGHLVINSRSVHLSRTKPENSTWWQNWRRRRFFIFFWEFDGIVGGVENEPGQKITKLRLGPVRKKAISRLLGPTKFGTGRASPSYIFIRRKHHFPHLLLSFSSSRFCFWPVKRTNLYTLKR
jgi:hypothetical protein